MPTCDHVALLVRSIEATLERLPPGLDVGPVEAFPDEGTREAYIGEPGRPGKLLLMQALGEVGPYARALAKRGPGLHHVAYTVPDARAFVGTLPGWLLHPRSLDTWDGSRTLWLARPGVGTLVEVHEGKASYHGEPVVAGVTVVGPPAVLACLAGATAVAAGEPALRIGDRVLAVGALTA